jgi:hypothetical protein
VELTVDAPTLLGTWTMRATNKGDVPVRLAADARLLTLEVTPRGETHPVRCELPADLRPADDLDRSLVLPPGRSYAEPFEPRLYCFGERALSALSSQAVVVARLGFPAGSRVEARQAISPIDGIEPVVGSLPFLTSAPIALPDEPSALPAEVVAPAGEPGAPALLRLTGSVAVDAGTLSDLVVRVTLQNDAAHPVRVRFKPETLAFDVVTSSGAEHCNWPMSVGAPQRELFSTLPPHGTESLSVTVGDYCNTRAFEHAGLIVLRPQLDTRHASGSELGLQTFDGQVIATSPTVVRLHRGVGKPVTKGRPHLEPLPEP